MIRYLTMELHWTDDKVVSIIVALGAAGLYLVYYYIIASTFKNFQDCRHLASQRRKKQKDRADQFCNLKSRYQFSSSHQEIVDLPFEKLVERLQGRTVKAREVLEAFIAKSLDVTSKLNCVTEYVPQCFEWADELDVCSEIKGPLHGIPFCVKDDHDIEGMDSTLGLSINLYKPAAECAAVVKVLMDAGAIPFCKTNLTQTTISAGSDNPIYGTTLNAMNVNLGPGGSSSGTGCLLAAGGAPFGLGSDLGGSVRMPAHFSGVTALRPTIRRTSGRGIKQIIEDLAGYCSVSGVMAPSIEVLKYVTKAIWMDAAQYKYDPLIVPIPWNEKVINSTTKLRIGFYTSMPFFPAFPDVLDTVLKAKVALETIGHTLVPINLPPTPEIMWVYGSLFNGDSQDGIYNMLKNDAVSPIATKFLEGRSFPFNLIQPARSFFRRQDVREFTGDTNATKSAVLWKYLKQLRLLKYRLLDEMKNLNVDVILGPVLPFPAARLDDAEILTILSVGYTCIWNGLDFPAGVLPFGTESGVGVDAYDDQGDYYFQLAKENVKAAKGMPIAVQVIARPFQEELVLRVLNELEECKRAQTADQFT